MPLSGKFWIKIAEQWKNKLFLEDFSIFYELKRKRVKVKDLTLILDNIDIQIKSVSMSIWAKFGVLNWWSKTDKKYIKKLAKVSSSYEKESGK